MMVTAFANPRSLAVLVGAASLLTMSNAQPTPAPTDQVENLCGDCWCVPEGGVDTGDCPALYPGLIQTIPERYPGLYKSMTLKEGATERPLQDANGNADCYPFQETLGSYEQVYPQSAWPQCQRYDSGGDEVCAFVYETEACSGRTYEAVTYATADAANAASVDDKLVHIAHKGACGVCSNAQDYAARLESMEIINGLMVLCASSYTTKPDKNKAWTELIQCIKKGISFTDPCATLWAHFAATNAAECPLECVANGAGDIVLNGDAPTCPLSECLKCSADAFEEDFNTIAGIWKSPYNAGIVDEIAYPCTNFYRVDSHDPCVGATDDGATAPTPSPTEDKTSSATRRQSNDMATFFILSLCLTPLVMVL